MKTTRLLLALTLAAAGLFGACLSEPGPVEPSAPSVLDGSAIIGSGGKSDSTTTSSDTTTSDTTGSGG